MAMARSNGFWRYVRSVTSLLTTRQSKPNTHAVSKESPNGVSLRMIALIALPLFSLAGFYGTMVLSSANGTFEQVTNLMREENPLWPGTEESFIRTYTGVKAIDRQLSVLTLFFCPVADGHTAAIRGFSFFGLGQFGAIWALLMMESLRKGNSGKLVSFIGTVGVIFQNISYTVTIPLYLWLHLLTSPTAKSFPSTHANTVLMISNIDLTVLPLSIILGFGVPTVLMGLSYPETVSLSTHQKLIALWQPFPIWTVLIHWILNKTMTKIAEKRKKDNAATRSTPNSPSTSYLRAARMFYLIVLILTMVTHVPVLLVSLLPSKFLSYASSSFAVFSKPSFADIYIPPAPLTSHKAATLAEGSMIFLQWDLYIGSAACLLWGLVLHRNAVSERTIVDPDNSLPVYRQLLAGETRKRVNERKKLIAKVAIWMVLGGPIGALTVLLWERDEIVKQKIKQGI